jgi:hypothetical protein
MLTDVKTPTLIYRRYFSCIPQELHTKREVR